MPESSTETTPILSKELKLVPQERLNDPTEREIRGVWEAIHYVDRLAKDSKAPIDEQVIKNVHQKILGHFHPAVAGHYRDFEIAIKRAIFRLPHWSQVRRLMAEFGQELSTRTSNLPRSRSEMEKVVAVGAWAHYQLVRIHPFADGNGRTARLLTDLIFKRADLYYLTDWGVKGDEYVDVLRRVDQTGNLGHFEQFLARKLAARHEEVINLLTKKDYQISQRSPILAQVGNRRNELLRIARSRVS